MAPVFGRSRKNKGSKIFLRGDTTVIVLTAEKFFTELFGTKWQEDYSIEKNSIYVRTRKNGVLVVIGHRSVLDVIRDLLPNSQFFEVLPGLWINLDYVVEISEEDMAKKVVKVDIDGVIEAVGISRERASDLVEAWVEHQLRKLSRQESPPPAAPARVPARESKRPANDPHAEPAKKKKKPPRGRVKG